MLSNIGNIQGFISRHLIRLVQYDATALAEIVKYSLKLPVVKRF